MLFHHNETHADVSGWLTAPAERRTIGAPLQPREDASASVPQVRHHWDSDTQAILQSPRPAPWLMPGASSLWRVSCYPAGAHAALRWSVHMCFGHTKPPSITSTVEQPQPARQGPVPPSAANHLGFTPPVGWLAEDAEAGVWWAGGGGWNAGAVPSPPLVPSRHHLPRPRLPRADSHSTHHQFK